MTDKVIFPHLLRLVRCPKRLQRRRKAAISSRIEKRGIGLAFQGAEIGIVPFGGCLRCNDALASIEVEQLGAGGGMEIDAPYPLGLETPHQVHIALRL
jgi:hypothetical protein